MSRFLPLLPAVLSLIAHAVAAETVAIVDGRVLTMSAAGEIDPGTVLIRDGTIAAVGADVTVPADARVIDATGRIVTPGFVLPATGLSLVEVRFRAPSVDDRSCDEPCGGATFDVADAVNPDSTLIPAARLGGITRAIVVPSPGVDLFAGRAAAIHLSDGPGVVVVARVAMLVELGEAGAARAGGSRAAALAAVRAALDDAKDLADRRAADPDARASGASLPTAELEALQPVIDGSMPLVVSVHAAADIRRVLSLTADYDLRTVLLGADEGWRVAHDIARAGVPVILDPTHNGPGTFETMGATLDNARLLDAAGVMIAIRGNGPHRAREARYNAGNAVANGLPWAVALEAITVNPARIFGLDDRFGTLAPGRDADVVMWDGDPLEPLTLPLAIFVRGVEQPLRSRGTELRDRYLELDTDNSPAYR